MELAEMITVVGVVFTPQQMLSIRISIAAGPREPGGSSLSRKEVASTTAGFCDLEMGSSSLSTRTWMSMVSTS